MNRQGEHRNANVTQPPQRTMRPRSLTTPWLMEDIRDALASTGERRFPQSSRRRQLRLLFGV